MPVAEMSLLFATSFSRSCEQAQPAVTQWMRDVTSTLTLVHVHDPQHSSLASAQRKLRAFFSEADRSPLTKRVLLSGSDPAAALAAHVAHHPYDLVLCPVDQRAAGQPQPRSTRAKLLANTRVALWTGRTARVDRPRRVGCMLSARADSRRPVAIASEYARRVGATLQLIYVVPDGADERRPVPPELPLSSAPELHAVVGSDAQQIVSVLERAQTDLLFAGKDEALRSTPWQHHLQCFVDRARCPVICVDHDRSLPRWPLRLC